MEDSDPPDLKDRKPILVLDDVPKYIDKTEKLDYYSFNVLDNSSSKDYENRLKELNPLYLKLKKQRRYINKLLINEGMGKSPIKGGIPEKYIKKLTNLSKCLSTRLESIENVFPLECRA